MYFNLGILLFWIPHYKAINNLLHLGLSPLNPLDPTALLSTPIIPEAVKVYGNILFFKSKTTTNLYYIKLSDQATGYTGSLYQITLEYPAYGNDFTFFNSTTGLYLLVTGSNGIHIYSIGSLNITNGVQPIWISLATYSGASTQNYLTVDYHHAILYAVSDNFIVRWSNIVDNY